LLFTGVVLGGVSVKLRGYLKGRIRQAQRLYFETFRTFSPTELQRALQKLGIGSGATLLVHSSYDAFTGFSGKPTDVIAVLQSVVGTTGSVMMPTLPFTSTAVAYARSNPVFDVRRTPSRMGLISELFRRSAGVVRSVHPTHPVAVAGERAEQLVEGHFQADTPCGKGSPFARLLDVSGKILLLGTDIGVLTFYHTVEELLEKKLPASPFTTEIFSLQSRDYSGNLVTTRTRLFDPGMSRRRNLGKLVPELRQARAWREAGVGNLKMVLLDAQSVLAAAENMADRGTYCYD
jgi:aminoglycoside 3-N-acetyltransferase